MAKLEGSYSAYKQVAHPEEGARRPAGKPDSKDDALGHMVPKSHQTKFEATEKKGACLEAMKKQVYGAPENQHDSIAEGSNGKKRPRAIWGVDYEGND